MLGVMLVQPSLKSGKKPSWVKLWNQNLKTFKKTGIKLRDAILLSPEGVTMAHEGDATITDNDIKVRNRYPFLGQWAGIFCSCYQSLINHKSPALVIDG